MVFYLSVFIFCVCVCLNELREKGDRSLIRDSISRFLTPASYDSNLYYLVKPRQKLRKPSSLGVAVRCDLAHEPRLYPAFFQKFVHSRTTVFSLVIAVIIFNFDGHISISDELAVFLTAVQPFEESVPRDNDSAVDNVELRKALFLHQLVGTGTGNAEEICHVHDRHEHRHVFQCFIRFHSPSLLS